ncbi:DnaJ family domain-containing protein [Zoogloea sp.]|uniref:DnaJ family domain-containing protein n=1 Tax=Zoogloea sp. TaxID=49181 RepID=UPI00261F2276|nr:DnaJ family domain-containing protein [uncultured Zoogloea sp.]
MSIFDQLAEEKIRAALAQGQLSGLPGEGRPLEFDDDALVPAELRMSNRILRNAGYVPPAILELRELRALCEALAAGGDEGASAHATRRLTSLLLRVEAAGLSHVASAILARLSPRTQVPPAAPEPLP